MKIQVNHTKKVLEITSKVVSLDLGLKKIINKYENLGYSVKMIIK